MQAYKYETFTVTHSKREYHYTLYYYDQAGNLIKTVAPRDVNANFAQAHLDSRGDQMDSILLNPVLTMLKQNFKV
jgi:hypothetical protein